MVMNPEQNTENLNLERKVGPVGPEFIGDLPESPETQQQSSIERGAEAKELTSEAKAAAVDGAVVQPQSTIPPAIPAPSLQGVTSLNDAGGSVLEAADEDNIEKEWVDKTKSVIKSTKGDPHLREQGIVGVREEYQKKRFNRTRGDA